jgi:tetratricopeptide (TPR) repeat protein
MQIPTKSALQSNKYLAQRGLLAAALSIVLLGLLSCGLSSDRLEFEKAKKAERSGDYEQALKSYTRIVEAASTTKPNLDRKNLKSSTNGNDIKIEAAQEAARVSQYHLRRYNEAVDFLRYIILNSSRASERLEAQRRIADIYFNQFLNYQQAITEYSRLLDLEHTASEGFQYKMAIARSYFYLNNFFQSLVEIDRVLAGKHDKDLLYDAILLKANVLLAMKKLDGAIVVLQELMAKYPERSKAETIGLTLAVTYEEQRNFSKAIETLERIRDIYPRKSFIENRIRALKERQSHLPGARGLVK